MKVWEKLAELTDVKSPKNEIIAACYTHTACPAEFESEYHFIGDRRFKKHCDTGCGVKCLEEYLDLDIKKYRHYVEREAKENER